MFALSLGPTKLATASQTPCNCMILFATVLQPLWPLQLLLLYTYDSRLVAHQLPISSLKISDSFLHIVSDQSATFLQLLAIRSMTYLWLVQNDRQPVSDQSLTRRHWMQLRGDWLTTVMWLKPLHVITCLFWGQYSKTFVKQPLLKRPIISF